LYVGSIDELDFVLIACFNHTVCTLSRV
jgi:hypothetical protein